MVYQFPDFNDAAVREWINKFIHIRGMYTQTTVDNIIVEIAQTSNVWSCESW